MDKCEIGKIYKVSSHNSRENTHFSSSIHSIFPIGCNRGGSRRHSLPGKAATPPARLDVPDCLPPSELDAWIIYAFLLPESQRPHVQSGAHLPRRRPEPFATARDTPLALCSLYARHSPRHRAMPLGFRARAAFTFDASTSPPRVRLLGLRARAATMAAVHRGPRPSSKPSRANARQGAIASRALPLPLRHED